MVKPQKVTLKSGEVRYRATVDVGRDVVTGARRQKVITARSVAEFKEKLRQAQTGRAPSSNGRQLVRVYLLDEWLPWKESSGVKPITLDRYERDIRRHLVPAFGAQHLEKVSRRDVERWVQQMRGRYAAASVQAWFGLFSQAMKQAYHWEYIERNPCAGVRVGSSPSPRKQVWSVEQARHFLAATRDDPDHLLWRVLLIGGLRIGEALALSWGCVDYQAGVLRVSRTMTKDRHGKRVIGTTTKTARSTRPVDLDPETMRLLRERQARASSVLVFPNRAGGLWNSQTVWDRLTAACGEFGLPAVSAHDLRHLSITMAIASGMNVAAVSARVGHSNSQITLSVYTHALPDSGRVVADALGELLAGGE